MTVYATFTDKSALFEAIVTAENSAIERAIEAVPRGTRPIADLLTDAGSALLTLLLRSDVMRFDRMLAGEMTRHPDLGRRFYEAGPHRMWALLTSIVEHGRANGELTVVDAHAAAEDLISIWLGMVPMQERLGAAAMVSAATVARRVEHGVWVFMRAYSSAERPRPR